jgi:hypothetical protein
MFTGSKMFTGTVTRFKNTGGSRDTHGTNIVHTAVRDTPLTRVRVWRAVLARMPPDRPGWRACAGYVRPHVRLWFWCRGTLYWVGNRTERLKEKQRLTSCDGAQELHATWLLAMYTGRLRGDRRGAREVGW